MLAKLAVGDAAQPRDLKAFFGELKSLADSTVERGLAQFLNRFAQFREGNVAEQRYDAFANEMARIRRELATLRERTRAEDRSRACSYNVFEILGLSTYEVTTHSAFLGNLFSPRGSHAQGALFFRAFVETVAPPERQARFLDGTGDQYEVTLEKGTGEGYIDLLIESTTPLHRWAMVVENKVFAGDQPRQLERYYAYATRECDYSDDELLIVYLTPDGHAPATFSLGWGERTRLLELGVLVDVSYKQHVADWLARVLPLIEAPTVAEVVRQYLKTIELLGRR